MCVCESSDSSGRNLKHLKNGRGWGGGSKRTDENEISVLRTKITQDTNDTADTHSTARVIRVVIGIKTENILRKHSANAAGTAETCDRNRSVILATRTAPWVGSNCHSIIEWTLNEETR